MYWRPGKALKALLKDKKERTRVGAGAESRVMAPGIGSPLIQDPRKENERCLAQGGMRVERGEMEACRDDTVRQALL